MSNAFETRVDRRDRGNLKALAFTPAHIREAGYVSFAGAEFEFPTAPAVIEAVQAAAGNGLFGYTVADAPYFDAVRWWPGYGRRRSRRTGSARCRGPSSPWPRPSAC